jgi:hypothetical protein
VPRAIDEYRRPGQHPQNCRRIRGLLPFSVRRPSDRGRGPQASPPGRGDIPTRNPYSFAFASIFEELRKSGIAGGPDPVFPLVIRADFHSGKRASPTCDSPRKYAPFIGSARPRGRFDAVLS